MFFGLFVGIKELNRFKQKAIAKLSPANLLSNLLKTPLFAASAILKAAGPSHNSNEGVAAKGIEVRVQRRNYLRTFGGYI